MRHLIIPDTQVKPGNDLKYLDWASRAIVDYQADRVIHLGDHYDMNSLNGHSEPGALELEGARYRKDIDAGNEGFERLTHDMKKLKKYKPELIYLTGNHEERIPRTVAREPKFEGVLTYDDFETQGFKRYEFLQPVFRDGIAYSHYWQNINSSRAIGGEISARIGKIMCSFVQGHEQGFKYGNRVAPTGKIYHGIVAGSYYLHDEGYKGLQGNRHWRGLVVLNEVKDGTFDVMPLSIEYLESKYGDRKRMKK